MVEKDGVLDGKAAPLVPAGPEKWTWPPEVLTFARQAQVAQYLDPLMEETRQLFPQARAMRVYVEKDPELPDDHHIGWEIDLEMPNLSDYRGLSRRLGEALRRIVPAPLACAFRQYLRPVKG
jgi:hypothetical protein